MNTAHQPPIAADAPNLRRALVLAGGGLRVAYQAGAVKALFDEGMRFSHADGASGGTINLAALMSGMSPDELCARWRTLPVRHFIGFRPLREYLRMTNMSGFGSADGMVRKVFPALGIYVDRIRGATGIDASFNVCRFDDKSVIPIPHTELDIARLVAASSLPIFLPAVQADGATWTDAVWIQDANLMSCVERGARELWLVWCIGNTRVYRNGAFKQYVHMIEMSALGALQAELAALDDMNRRIAQGEVVLGHSQPIRLYVIKPELPLPLDPDFFLGRIDAATLINMGYRDARRSLRSHQPAALDPTATMMREPGVGVMFRETMRGRFSLGMTDPQDGARAAGSVPLVLHASIQIEDISAFVASSEHKGGLVGHIHFEPWGRAVPAQSGVFGLFSPSGDPLLTYMIYELGLHHAGEDYYLAGRKLVRIGKLAQLWSATTTLFVQLHRGSDTHGEVIGAGVLTLGVSDLLRLLVTVHATNPPTAWAGMRAVWRFVQFFASELVRTYVRRRPRPLP
jgi:predicted patatin/cPLA2 family phospholipase